ncbi:DnaJ subfamily C member 3 [Portunus trituberculatus]|uniref:DnaJ subfamily C member 3 n=1 Tax=Portunus trituberculatus TaxID=210409 RepID=A0A5B7FLJ8_PORTR|nr:DnaJ subfamily C member 3 [Portunus trituberculatus]
MQHSNCSCGTDGDPSNYLSYYRRATVYLALGRSRTGLQDLDEVIRLKPDFTAARAQRGGVLVKLGRLEEAHIDLENVLRKEPTHEEANRLYVMIEPLKREVLEAYSSVRTGRYHQATLLLKGIIEPHPTSSLVSKAHRIEGRPTHSSKGKRAGACDVSRFTNMGASSQDVSFLHGNLTLSLCPLSKSYLPGTGDNTVIVSVQL